MRIKLLLSCSLLASTSHYALADMTAPITDVILFPGSATIVRTVAVTAGNTQVVIPGLPARFDAQTLHAEAAAGIRIGEITTKDIARTEARSKTEADMEAQIQALEDQTAMLDADAKSADIVKTYLERLGGDSTGADKQSRSPIDAKTLAGLIDTIGRGANDALSKMQRIIVQKREIEKKIAALKRDLARQHTNDNDARTVSINVNADRAGLVKLSYQINNAGWKPAYRASLDSVASKVELERLATISQKTGEDWSNIKLTLSTNQPRLSPVGPDPKPWLLSYYAPAPPPVSSPAPANYSAQKIMVTGSRISRADMEENYEPPTFETQSTFSTQFEVPTRVNLQSDGREVSVTLAKQTLAVKQMLRITPRLDRAAIVMAVAEQPQGVWPQGTMQLIRDGNYVGASAWNPQANENLSLSYGRDDLVKVEVNPVKTNSASTGIFDKKSERKLADVFSITNTHKTAIEIEVLESSPVSTSDEIKVQALFDPKPSNDAWEQRRGVVAWKKTVQPNATAKFSVDYTIEYPKEGSVGGLR
ncbi:mucoidy inhibitor MuiA family protein [Solimicrobium silvestre]|uniref:DUF4139 domain-containing protein n=1 Tax=Solimicrobium silvestre TaxID=2099400 RepID=A0A2S9H4L5_9BURK|nr:mucoidy inhibitor MuiA family protein [Solimicrobium silvestre]PRC94919.1 hypothetical protein S2091_0114 [Solimicrobium silvestre]